MYHLHTRAGELPRSASSHFLEIDLHIKYNGEVKDLFYSMSFDGENAQLHNHTMICCVGHTSNHGVQLTYKTRKTAKLLVLVFNILVLT